VFTHTVHRGLYRTHVLTDTEARSSIEVVPERGGIVTRWSIGEQDILYLDHDRFTNPELSVRGGIPVLFPICGNLINDSYTHEGKTYTLKQHGFARDLPWQMTANQHQDHASITVSLSDTPQTQAVYPFAFRLDFSYELLGTSLTIRQRYTNPGTVRMPFSAGFHPYFAAPAKSALAFTLPVTTYTDKATQQTKPFNGFNFEDAEIDWAFQDLTGTKALVRDRARGMTLSLTSESTFSTLVFWTVRGKDFYCLEPWSAPRNSLNTGKDLFWLEPGSGVEWLVRLDITVP